MGRKGLFEGLQVVLDLSGERLQFKKNIRTLLEKNGAIVSFVVQRNSTAFLVCTVQQWGKHSSSRIRTAQRCNIPVVKPEFVTACVSQGKLLQYHLFAPVAPQKPSSVGEDDAVEEEHFVRREPVKPPTVAPATYGSDFHHNAAERIAMGTFFVQMGPNAARSKFHALELHVSEASGSGEGDTELFRVFEHFGKVSDLYPSDGEGAFSSGGTRQYREVSSIEEALSLYESIATKLKTQKKFHETSVISARVGSNLARLQGLATGAAVSALPRSVQQLVTTIYEEALTFLRNRLDLKLSQGGASAVLQGPLGTVSRKSLVTAEALLLQMELMLTESKEGSSEFSELVDEYRSATLQSSLPPSALHSSSGLETQRELIGLMRDVIFSSEGLGTGTDVDMRYEALNRRVVNLQELNSALASKITTQLEEDNRNRPITVTGIYQLYHAAEQQTFHSVRAELRRGVPLHSQPLKQPWNGPPPLAQDALERDRTELAFHGTRASNVLGVLSRGLLLPGLSERGIGERRDYGRLGRGIYLSDSAYTAVKYCERAERGQRYLFVSEVLPGRVAETSIDQPSLRVPPGGFDSVRTRSKATDPSSTFDDVEICLYSAGQQTLRYLVEFHFKDEDVAPVVGPGGATEQALVEEAVEQLRCQFADVTVADQAEVEEVVAKARSSPPVAEVITGLIGNGAEIPLRATHVRGSLQDVVARVTIIQEYSNMSAEAIEAKYVFPLDDLGAVCGFEAFINGKHVVGEVKEKEQAHKEYKEAVAKGHGAYLMDQEDQPDIFSVKVGNLPPQSTVLIKITYVTELRVEGDDVVFLLPSSMGGSAREKFAHDVTQQATASVLIEDGYVPQTLELGIEMPYVIADIYSPSHPQGARPLLRMKATDCEATVSLDNSVAPSLGGRDFELHITLSDAYRPRMWVEEEPIAREQPGMSEQLRAAMLVFYPRFDYSSQIDNEFVFLLDRSASMGTPSAVSAAMRVLELAFDSLPQPCYVNVVTFGSHSERLFVSSKENTAETLQKIRAFLASPAFEISLGCTDVSSALASQYLLVDKKRPPRTLILVSDGHVHQLQATLALVRANAGHTRLFCLGVEGTDGINRHALRALANAGGGATELLGVSGKTSQDPYKVQKQLSRALQPAMRGVRLDWEGTSSKREAPAVLPSIFSGERVVVFALVDHALYCTLSCSGAGEGERISERISTSPLLYRKDDLLHKLTARAILRDYEEGSLSGSPEEEAAAKAVRKQEIIALSCSYNVVCSLTSFLAVEERGEEEQARLRKGIGSTTKGPSAMQLCTQLQTDKLQQLAWGGGMEEKAALLRALQEKEEEAAVAVASGEALLGEENAESTPVSKSSIDLLLDKIDASVRAFRMGEDGDSSPEEPANEQFIQAFKTTVLNRANKEVCLVDPWAKHTQDEDELYLDNCEMVVDEWQCEPEPTPRWDEMALEEEPKECCEEEECWEDNGELDAELDLLLVSVETEEKLEEARSLFDEEEESDDEMGFGLFGPYDNDSPPSPPKGSLRSSRSSRMHASERSKLISGSHSLEEEGDDDCDDDLGMDLFGDYCDSDMPKQKAPSYGKGPRVGRKACKSVATKSTRSGSATVISSSSKSVHRKSAGKTVHLQASPPKIPSPAPPPPQPRAPLLAAKKRSARSPVAAKAAPAQRMIERCADKSELMKKLVQVNGTLRHVEEKPRAPQAARTEGLMTSLHNSLSRRRCTIARNTSRGSSSESASGGSESDDWSSEEERETAVFVPAVAQEYACKSAIADEVDYITVTPLPADKCEVMHPPVELEIMELQMETEQTYQRSVEPEPVLVQASAIRYECSQAAPIDQPQFVSSFGHTDIIPTTPSPSPSVTSSYCATQPSSFGYTATPSSGSTSASCVMAIPAGLGTVAGHEVSRDRSGDTGGVGGFFSGRTSQTSHGPVGGSRGRKDSFDDRLYGRRLVGGTRGDGRGGGRGGGCAGSRSSALGLGTEERRSGFLFEQQQQHRQQQPLNQRDSEEKKKKRKKKGKKEFVPEDVSNRRSSRAKGLDNGRYCRDGDSDSDRSKKRDRASPEVQTEGRRSPLKAARLNFSATSIVALQESDGSWNLTQELERHLGLQVGSALSILQSAGLSALAEEERRTAPALFATAMAILALEATEEADARSSISRGRQWLERTERQTISAAYQLGLGSCWTVAARGTLQQRSGIWRSCVSEGATWNTPLADVPRGALSPSGGAGLVQLESTYGIPAGLQAGEILYH